MKGVSPVVATVLLIAIAVIAAIGVWYWVGAYTGKPAVGVEQRAFSIESCKITNTTEAEVLIRNTGALTLSDDATVYNAAGLDAGLINLSGSNLAAGAVEYVTMHASNAPTTNITAGVYNVVDSSYPSYQFTCSA